MIDQPARGRPRTGDTAQFKIRLKPRYREMMQEVADERGGLTLTRVFELAIEQLHRKVIGRGPVADRKPVRVRTAKPTRPEPAT
ncbi:MAG: hypothetical protein ACLQGP_03020 [Isosphaeraceae bacterium]